MVPKQNGLEPAGHRDLGHFDRIVKDVVDLQLFAQLSLVLVLSDEVNILGFEFGLGKEAVFLQQLHVPFNVFLLCFGDDEDVVRSKFLNSQPHTRQALLGYDVLHRAPLHDYSAEVEGEPGVLHGIVKELIIMMSMGATM